MSDYNFIIDIQSRRLIADYFSTEASTPPSIVFGDQPTVNVQLVEANNDSAGYPWKSVALTGQSIRVGVGSLEDATPSAYIELTADLAAASSVITEIRTGVLNTTNEIQRVQILDAVKGNYTLTIAGETTTPLCLDASLEEITDAVEALASITADSVEVTGNPTDYRIEFDSSLADVGAITVNLDNITSRVGKTGTLDLHVTEILTLLDDETSVEATLEVVRWTTADVAGETVLQVPVTVKQDVIPDTVPGTTPLPGYATIDLDHINQSGATTGQVPSWNGSEWVPITAAGTGDLLSTNNLSDVADAPTALTNLGAASASHTHNLSDINQDGATNAQVITFNSTSGEWEAADSAGGTIAAADITDATADGIALITSADANSFTDAQQTLLGQQSGTNTGDQDLSGYVQTTAIDTLAELNTVVTDATLIDTGDSRLSDARTPTSHAASHTDGSDDIQSATNLVKGLATAAHITAIEANTAASHAAVTVSDSAEIDLTLAGQDITASLIASSIDETKLDASVNASLDLADSASQPGHSHVISDITDNVAASTGVLTGGVLSTGAGATEYSISDGTGIIVDETGAITDVSWSGKSNITPTNIATSLLTWVSIDSAGNVVEMTSPCSPSSRRSEICLGVIVHVDKATVDAVNNEQVVAFNPHSSVYDLADALGFINVSGNVYSANGANLNINKSVGEIFATGSNYDTSATNPHIKTLAVLSALTFQYRYSDGSNGVTGTAITPDVLDDGAGGTTAVTNNRWSVQRIYSFVSNNVKIQLGVEDFISKDAAIAGIASEAYITEPSIAANGLLRGWLVVKKGTTDLSDTTQAQFIEAGKLGEVGSAGGGGAGNVVAELGIAVSDETTALTTGTAKGTFRMPYAMTVTDVRATVTTAPTGANIIVDINDGGTSIMTTNKLSIDATEKTSTTAATAPGVTDTALADDAEISIDIDQIGSTIAGAGLKIWIIGTRA